MWLAGSQIDPAAQNTTAGVTNIVEDDVGDQSRTTARAR
jgi:hypothetical protein